MCFLYSRSFSSRTSSSCGLRCSTTSRFAAFLSWPNVSVPGQNVTSSVEVEPRTFLIYGLVEYVSRYARVDNKIVAIFVSQSFRQVRALRFLTRDFALMGAVHDSMLAGWRKDMEMLDRESALVHVDRLRLTGFPDTLTKPFVQ